jgi:hypothetical protein
MQPFSARQSSQLAEIYLGQLTERKIHHLGNPKSPTCRMHFGDFCCML